MVFVHLRTKKEDGFVSAKGITRVPVEITLREACISFFSKELGLSNLTEEWENNLQVWIADSPASNAPQQGTEPLDQSLTLSALKLKNGVALLILPKAYSTTTTTTKVQIPRLNLSSFGTTDGNTTSASSPPPPPPETPSPVMVVVSVATPSPPNEQQQKLQILTTNQQTTPSPMEIVLQPPTGNAAERSKSPIPPPPPPEITSLQLPSELASLDSSKSPNPPPPPTPNQLNQQTTPSPVEITLQPPTGNAAERSKSPMPPPPPSTPTEQTTIQATPSPAEITIQPPSGNVSDKPKSQNQQQPPRSPGTERVISESVQIKAANIQQQRSSSTIKLQEQSQQQMEEAMKEIAKATARANEAAEKFCSALERLTKLEKLAEHLEATIARLESSNKLQSPRLSLPTTTPLKSSPRSPSASPSPRTTTKTSTTEQKQKQSPKTSPTTTTTTSASNAKASKRLSATMVHSPRKEATTEKKDSPRNLKPQLPTEVHTKKQQTQQQTASPTTSKLKLNASVSKDTAVTFISSDGFRFSISPQLAYQCSVVKPPKRMYEFPHITTQLLRTIVTFLEKPGLPAFPDIIKQVGAKKLLRAASVLQLSPLIGFCLLFITEETPEALSENLITNCKWLISKNLEDWCNFEKDLKGNLSSWNSIDISKALDILWFTRYKNEFGNKLQTKNSEKLSFNGSQNRWKNMYCEMRIQTFLLSGLSTISKEELSIWELQIGSFVETLDLSNSDLINDEAVGIITQFCSSLTSLNLSNCRNVNDQSINNHLTKNPSLPLKLIRLEGTSVSKDSLAILKQNFTAIEVFL